MHPRGSSSDEDEQRLKNDQLFSIIRKKVPKKQIEDEIRKCIKDGAKINALNSRGKTLLDLAQEKNYEDVAKFLEAEGGKTRVELQSVATKGDGNCFFHATFGKNSSGTYIAKSAESMRQEWYNFLHQFESLQDNKMPPALQAQLKTIFNFFLDNPKDLSGRSEEIKKLVNEAKEKINFAFSQVQELKNNIKVKLKEDRDFRDKIYQIIQNANEKANKPSLLTLEELLANEAKLTSEICNNLEECVLKFKPELSVEEYRKSYNSQTIANEFLVNTNLYRNYLEAIKNRSYYVFFEEIPILASLANIEIKVYYNKGQNSAIFKPQQELIGDYQPDCNIWGTRGEVIIRHEGIHFSYVDYDQPEISHKRKNTEINEEREANRNPKLNSDEDSTTTNTSNIQGGSNKRKPTGELNIDDIIPNKQQRFLDKSEMSSEGIKLAEHGNIFQLKLLMLCLWRAACQEKNNQKTYGAFRLATEMPKAEKFDDIVFQYKDSNTNTWKFRLLQAKHKEGKTLSDPLEKITLENLLSTDNGEAFSLQKYFHSYLKIHQRTKENSIYSVFSGNEIEDVVVITNTDFAFGVDQKKSIFEKSTKVDNLLGTKELPTVNPEIWKFKPDNIIINKLKIVFENSSDFYKLIESLADYILSDKQIDKEDIFKEYHYPLLDQILKINQKTGKGDVQTFENDEDQLEDLAVKLADIITNNKALTIQDFKNDDVAILNKVINIKKHKLKLSFVNPSGKDKEILVPLRNSLMEKLKELQPNQKITNDYLKNLKINNPLLNQILKIDNLNNFIYGKDVNGEILSEEGIKIRDALIKEIAFRKGEVHIFEIDKNFGNKNLPNDEIELQRLAIELQRLADVIVNNKVLTIQDFKNDQIVLSKHVIDIEKRKLKLSFVNPSGKDKEILVQLRNSLMEKLKELQPNQKITNDYLKNLEIKISKNFGISTLSDNEMELNDLAEKLTSFIKQDKSNKQTLTIDAFQKEHSALANEVIDINAKTFHKIFINGKETIGGKVKELSPEAKKLRRILLDEFKKQNIKIKIKDKKTTINDLAKDTNKDLDKELLKYLLNEGELKISEGFGKVFKADQNLVIENIDLFSKQMVELIDRTKEQKVITINEEIIKKVLKTNDEKLKSFFDNIKKLAGYVLIDRFDKIRFSTSFLNLKSDNLPQEINEFRNKLKELLGDNRFTSLFEYELKFDHKLKFNTCEDGELYRKLPYLHSDKDVTDFFAHLKVIVNYPNRMQISYLLGKEIRDQFKTLDSEGFQAIYYKKIHNWMADRVGTFYTAANAETLFSGVQDNLSLFTIDGFNKPYFANSIRGYRFEKYDILGDFLLSEKQVLEIFYQDLSLGHTRIVQAFEELQANDAVNMQQYTRTFGHILLSLKQLEDKKFSSEIEKALKNRSEFNLMVIECNAQQQKIEGSLYQKLDDLLKSNNNKSNKKVIFITTKNYDSLSKRFANNPKYKFKDDKSGFHDLIEESQKKLFSQKVIFQGQQIILSKLIDVSDQKAKEIIDTKTLVKLMKGGEISIGNTIQDLGEVNDYYIDRWFTRQITLNKEKITKDLKNISERSNIQADLFFISGIDSIKSFKDIKNIHVFDNGELAEVEFEKLHKQYPESNIHWLKNDSERLSWYKSYGSISNLVPYREIKKVYDCTSLSAVHEDNLVHKEIVIIADIAGMGKSTLLTSLAKKLKAEDPSLWVIRINLNEHTEIFLKLLNNRKSSEFKFFDKDVNKTVNFLLKDLLGSQEKSKLKPGLEEELFKNSFNQGKVALLFDGFDEISPIYDKIVISLIKSCKRSKVQKLFVTSRPNKKIIKKLEKELDGFSYILDPLSEGEQIEFLTKFWRKKLNVDNLDQKDKERLEIYANSILKQFSKGIKERGRAPKASMGIYDIEQGFTTIPLHMMMLAEVFQDNLGGTKSWLGCKAFLKSEEAMLNNVSNNFGILDLYEGFVKRKFYDFYLKNKKARILSIVCEKDTADEEYTTFKKEHEMLALCALLDKEKLVKLLFTNETKELNTLIEKIKSGKYNKGIIDQIIDDEPHFIHRTFAEYFVANRIYSWFEQSEHKPEILAEILIEDNSDNEVIQRFFDQKLEKQPISSWEEMFNSLIGEAYDYDYDLLKKIIQLLQHFNYANALLHEFYNNHYKVFEQLFIQETDEDTMQIIIDAMGDEAFEVQQLWWKSILKDCSYDELEDLIEQKIDVLYKDTLQDPLDEILDEIPSDYQSDHDSEDGHSRTSEEFLTDLYQNGYVYDTTHIRDHLREKYLYKYERDPITEEYLRPELIRGYSTFEEEEVEEDEEEEVEEDEEEELEEEEDEEEEVEEDEEEESY